MVAISLYRGNLHRVSHLNQKWVFPANRISFKDFSRLVRKRHISLSRINPNPRSQDRAAEVVEENGCSEKRPQQPISDSLHEGNNNGGDSNEVDNRLVREEVEGDAVNGVSQAVAEEGPVGLGKSDLEIKNGVEVSSDKDKNNEEIEQKLECLYEKKNNIGQMLNQIKNDADVLSEKDKKKQELEQKLQLLNEKKHGMVQMLKQILHAEEEMKKRSNMSATVMRSPNPSQVDTTNDMGANPKHPMNRMGSEGNSCADLEGESEDASNHTAHARHLQQMSPSASSPLRRPSHGSLQYNVVPHTTRPSLGTTGHGQTASSHMGVTASPSRFAPSGHQSHSAGLPPLATSGTPFTASSPSPAASGGTSVFRDPRWTSPTWN